MIRYFSDRSQAGGLLAKKLKVNYANKPDVLVLGLPRGGLPVAYEVAKLLHAPLDICIVRKLGEPGYKEVAMGAIGTAREPLPPEPGKPERYDYQYERNGVNNLFMFFEPLGYWRHVEVTDQRTAIDYAQQMKYLVDERYPNAIAITVIHYSCSIFSL